MGSGFAQFDSAEVLTRTIDKKARARRKQRTCKATEPLSITDNARSNHTYEDGDVKEGEVCEDTVHNMLRVVPARILLHLIPE